MNELVPGDKIYEFVKSDGWKEVKDILLKKLATLDSISTVEMNRDATQILEEVKLRANVSAVILQWIGEVEGEANKYSNNKDLFVKIREEEFITFH